MKLRRKDLAREYGVDLRTIDRWRIDETLPKAFVDGGDKPYWTQEQIAAAEQISLGKMTYRDKQIARKAARLRKHRRVVKITTGQIIPNQLSLFQLNG